MKLSDVVEFLDDPSAFDILYKGSKVKYLNEAGSISDSSRFFVAGFEFGAHVLVHVESYRGDGFEAAWSTWIDSMPEIPADELVEAYGPQGTPDGSFIDMAHAEARGDNPPYGTQAWNDAMARIRARAKEMLDACVDAASGPSGNGEYPELIEGYEEKESGGGVVSVGHYAWMNEADLDDIEIVRHVDVPEFA